MKHLVIPGILVKSKKRLQKQLNQVDRHVNEVQIDIVDGRFARNKTIIPEDIVGVKTKLKLEVQLMVKKPLLYLDDLKKAKTKRVIFHRKVFKTNKQVLDAIKQIKAKEMKVGIALNPETSAEKIKPFLRRIDMVLVMTIHPGAQGRRLMPSTLKKVEKIRKWSKKIDIGVDGGVNEKTIAKCAEAGANRFVAGSAVFKKNDVGKAIKQLKQNL